MSKPDITNYTDERLADWHLFALRSLRANEVTQAGRVHYRRELRRIEAELADRGAC